MALESGTFISDLVPTNPPGTDLKSQGDDHLQLIKKVLKNTFPNANKAFNFPTTSSFSTNATLAAADNNKRIFVGPSSASFTLTMPALTGADDGWEVTIIKSIATVFPVFIAPPSGNIVSGQLTGLSKTRRCVPFVPFKVMWVGGLWIVERCIREPVGAIVPIGVQNLPVGYEPMNGQTLSSADYPDYTQANAGSSVVLDLRERAIVGYNDSGTFMDRVNPGRHSIGPINPTVFGNAGGVDAELLLQSRLPNVALSVSGTWGSSATPTFTGSVADARLNPGEVFASWGTGGNTGFIGLRGGGAGGTGAWGSLFDASVSVSGTVSLSGNLAGGTTSSINGAVGQTYTTNVPPAIVARYAVVVE